MVNEAVQSLVVYFLSFIASASGQIGPELDYPFGFDSEPEIVFHSPERLHLIRYNSLPSEDSAMTPRALYLFGGRILLENGWDYRDPGDQSILLHELVHFLQDMNGIHFDCKGDMERQAYTIQEKWLEEKHGLTLYEATGTHPLVMVAEMYCHNPNLARPGEPGP